jgi:hypothetical protein
MISRSPTSTNRLLAMRGFGSKSFGVTFLALCIFAISLSAQDAGQRSADGRIEGPDQPKTMQEMMKKMQIDQAKKEYEEMLDRGQQALKISQEVEKDFSAKNQLSRSDIEKLDSLEKLVKKIRGELGGGDGDDSDADADGTKVEPVPNNPADAVKALGTFTSKLVDELQKTSRFGISAIAIESSNAVIKVVRFLRFSK